MFVFFLKLELNAHERSRATVFDHLKRIHLEIFASTQHDFNSILIIRMGLKYWIELFVNLNRLIEIKAWNCLHTSIRFETT